MNQPVQLAGRRRAGILSDMQAGLTQPMPPSISIRAQRFTLVDAAGVEVPVNLFDQQLGVYLDVVIVGANSGKSRQYYDKPYDPNNPMSPACFSDNGVAPSTNAPSPQHATCNGCPQAAWGAKVSALTGKGIPACSTRKKLAVVVANDPAQLVYLLNIPPASLKALSVYAQTLGQHQIQDAEGVRSADPADVVTRVYFDPQNQGALLFKGESFHTVSHPYIYDLLERADASGVIDTIVGNHDMPITGALPAPAPVQQLAPPVAFAQPQMQAPPPAPAFSQPMQQPFAPQQLQQPAQPFAPQQFQQPAPQAQQPVPQAQQAPRTRRGGARAGAGRPAAPQAPQAPPTHAPFQQQAPAPQAPAPGPAPFQPRAAQPAPQPEPVPSFLDRRPQAQQPAPGGAPAFGMANGSAPNADLSAAIDNAFGAPLQPRPRG